MTDSLAMAPGQVAPVGFFRRHYRGDYSLGRSYWAHTFLVQWLALLAAVLLLPWLADNFRARYASGAFLAMLASVVLVFYWAVVGTWASANKHVSRGGRAGWATAAKIVIFLGALKMVVDLVQAYPAIREHWGVAMGRQLGPPTTLQVRADGKSILLSGGINDGSAELLEQALQRTPGVDTVVLASEGGWIREGTRLAEVIRRRGLNTYVEQFCASACTVAFLAGKDRAAAPSAKIGFHSARSIGSPGKAADSKHLQRIYKEAGLPEAFVARALDTPHGDMWFPSHDMLMAARVVTRKSPGGETAAIATSARSRDAFDQQMRQVELFALLEERAPKEYKAALDAAWDKAARGAKDAEVILALRATLLRTVLSFVPLASDETLVNYLGLIQEQLAALERSDAVACVELIFPSGNNLVGVGAIPVELRTRELQVLTQVLREADASRRVPTAPNVVEEVIREAAAHMSDDEARRFFDEPERARSSKAQVCAAARAFVGGMAKIPLARRGRAVRIIFAA